MKRKNILQLAIILIVLGTTNASGIKPIDQKNIVQQKVEERMAKTFNLDEKNVGVQLILPTNEKQRLLKTSQLKVHLDSIFTQLYDTTGWYIYEKRFFTYNDKKQAVKYTTYLSSNTAPQQYNLNSQLEYEYDSDGNMIQKIISYWNNSYQRLNNIYKLEKSYNENGDLTLYIEYSWSDLTLSWNPKKNTCSMTMDLCRLTWN
jgi:hypothetical protein